MNPLLSKTDDLDFLLQQADALSIDVRIGDDGKINVNALKKTPATHGWNEKFARAIKQNRKLVEFAVTKKGWPEVFNPPGTAENLEKGAGMLVPHTGAGMGAMGALGAMEAFAPQMGIPATILSRLLAGTAGGTLGGVATKEPLGQSALEGATAAGTDLGLRGAVAGAKTAKNWLKRPDRLDREMMGDRVGKTIADQLAKVIPNSVRKIATSAKELGQKGKDTVVRVLNGPEANKEIEDNFHNTVKTIVSEVQKDAQNDIKNLRANFVKQFGFSPTGKAPKGAQASKQMVQALNEFKIAQEDARTIGPDLQKAFDDVAKEGRGAYDESGELKHSYSAIKNVQNKAQLNDKIEEIIQKADPSGNLTTLLQDTRDSYAKFKGYQDFVNIDNVMDKKGQWFNAQTLQKAVDANTNPTVRFIERRVKEGFEPLYNAVRRDAAPFTPKGVPNVSDNPLWGKDGGIRAAGSVPLLGRVAKSIPSPRFMGHYIGNTASPPVETGQLPVLLNSLVTKDTETSDQPQQ